MLLFLASLLLLFRLPAILNLSHAYLGGTQGDGGLYVWLVKSNLRDLTVLPWFNSYAFYPYGKTIAWSDNFILPSAIVGLFSWLGVEFTLAYNLMLLLANLLNGYCTYRLIFKLGGRTLAAFFAGALLMCCSYLSVHLGHPQLQFFFFIPLALIALFSFTAKPSALSAFGISLCVVGAFLSAVYYALFCLVACAAVFVALIMLHPRHFKVADYLYLGLGALAGMILLAPFVTPYLEVRTTLGERGLYEAYYFSASLISYLSSSAANALYQGRLFNDPSEEGNLFSGFTLLILAIPVLLRLCASQRMRLASGLCFVPLVLALAFSLRSTLFPVPIQLLLCALCLWLALLGALFYLKRLGELERAQGASYLTDRDLLAICLFGALVFLAISFGPLGNPVKHEFALGPFALLHAVAPGFDALRAVNRAGIGVLFFLIAACALFLARRVPVRFQIRTITLVLCLALLENFTRSIPFEPASERPEVFRTLAQNLGPHDVFVILPLAGSLDDRRMVKSWSEYARLNTTYMLWAFDLQRHFLNGYSGLRTKFMREAPRELARFPDERAIQALRHIVGVRWVVVVPNQSADLNIDDLMARAAGLGSKLRLVTQDTQGALLFELIGESKIGATWELIAPSSPQGKVVLTLAVRKAPLTLEVLLPKQAPGAILLQKEIAPSERQEIQFDLPQTADSVRPLSLRLNFKGGGEAYLISSRFESQ